MPEKNKPPGGLNRGFTVYIEDNFFDECKRWLQSPPEEKKHLNIDKHTKQKLARNNWNLTCEGKVTASDNKLVVRRETSIDYYVKLIRIQQQLIEEETRQKDT